MCDHVWVPVCLLVFISLYVCLSVCDWLCVSVRVCLPVPECLCESVWLGVCLFVVGWVSLCVCLLLFLCVYGCVCECESVCVRVCVCVRVWWCQDAFSFPSHRFAGLNNLYLLMYKFYQNVRLLKYETRFYAITRQSDKRRNTDDNKPINEEDSNPLTV